MLNVAQIVGCIIFRLYHCVKSFAYCQNFFIFRLLYHGIEYPRFYVPNNCKGCRFWHLVTSLSSCQTYFLASSWFLVFMCPIFWKTHFYKVYICCGCFYFSLIIWNIDSPSGKLWFWPVWYIILYYSMAINLPLFISPHF